MNQNLEEQKIKQLFLELRQHDESRMPAFTPVLNSAIGNSRQLSTPWLQWRIAAAMALLVVVSGATFFVFQQSFTTQPGLVSAKAEAFTFKPYDEKRIPQREQISQAEVSKPQQPITARRGTTRVSGNIAQRKRTLYATKQPELLISNWHSPTDFLLKTPDAEWLRNLPQIGETLLDIKNLFPDDNYKR